MSERHILMSYSVQINFYFFGLDSATIVL